MAGISSADGIREVIQLLYWARHSCSFKSFYPFVVLFSREVPFRCGGTLWQVVWWAQLPREVHITVVLRRCSGSEKSGFWGLFYIWTVIVLSCLYLGSVGLKMLYGWVCKQLASADTRRLTVCFDHKRLIIYLRSLWFLER